MKTHRLFAVARWEYLRFAKAKDLILGTLIFGVLFAAGGLFGEFVARLNQGDKEVAVVDATRLGLEEPVEIGRFRLAPDARGRDELETALIGEDIDAALVPADGGWQLLVRQERRWQQELSLRLAALLQQAGLAEYGMSMAEVAALNAASVPQTTVVDPGARGASRASVLTTFMLVGAMGLGLFIGFSYVFVAITAEKTQRTTEMLLSCLSPQQWIDGKILGLTGVVLANLLTYAIGYGLYRVVEWLWLGNALSFPAGVGGVSLFTAALFSIAGFFFWFTLFAMVAATIDDPNSSGRSAVMFLPFLPMSAVIGGLDSPDALWMRVIAMIPGVSPAAMPVRLLRGDPAWFEVLISLALLVAAAMFFRRAAGRMFGVSMMMTGKEPGLREVLRWMRTAG